MPHKWRLRGRVGFLFELRCGIEMSRFVHFEFVPSFFSEPYGKSVRIRKFSCFAYGKQDQVQSAPTVIQKKTENERRNLSKFRSARVGNKPNKAKPRKARKRNYANSGIIQWDPAVSASRQDFNFIPPPPFLLFFFFEAPTKRFFYSEKFY